MERIKLPKKSTPQIRAYEAAVRRGRQKQHIIKTDNGWAIKSGGASKASKVLPTQEKAIRYGQKIAKEKKADLLIHGQDGKIKERQSYR